MFHEKNVFDYSVKVQFQSRGKTFIRSAAGFCPKHAHRRSWNDHEASSDDSYVFYWLRFVHVSINCFFFAKKFLDKIMFSSLEENGIPLSRDEETHNCFLFLVFCRCSRKDKKRDWWSNADNAQASFKSRFRAHSSAYRPLSKKEIVGGNTFKYIGYDEKDKTVNWHNGQSELRFMTSKSSNF